MTVDVKFDDRAFMAAMRRFAENSRKSNRELLETQARLFLKDVVKITPPNMDYKYRRDLGERAVKDDIKKVFRGVRAGSKGAVTDLNGLHQKYRRKSDGRVGKGPKNKFPASNLQAYIDSVLARVGILASGWNAACAKLGVKLPEWITRHGNAGGKIKCEFGWSYSKITVTNMVRFGDGVRGLRRRVQHALDTRAGMMDRQVDSYIQRSARRAGFR